MLVYTIMESSNKIDARLFEINLWHLSIVQYLRDFKLMKKWPSVQCLIYNWTLKTFIIMKNVEDNAGCFSDLNSV